MNSSLSQEDLSHFERRLRERMTQLRQEIEDTRQRERTERFGRVAGEAYDAGDASVASLTVDANNAEVLRDADELRDIDEALGRLAAGSYGLCLRCGEPIERARLEAYPPAKRHLKCQEAHETEFGTTRTPTL